MVDTETTQPLTDTAAFAEPRLIVEPGLPAPLPAGERLFLVLFLTGARGALDTNGDRNVNENIHVLLGGDLGLRGRDLSLRLGCAASLQETKLRSAIESVAAACKRAKKPWGLPVGSIEDARTVIGLGAQFVNFGNEFMAVMKQLETCSSQWKEAFGE